MRTTPADWLTGFPRWKTKDEKQLLTSPLLPYGTIFFPSKSSQLEWVLRTLWTSGKHPLFSLGTLNGRVFQGGRPSCTPQEDPGGKTGLMCVHVSVERRVDCATSPSNDFPHEGRHASELASPFIGNEPHDTWKIVPNTLLRGCLPCSARLRIHTFDLNSTFLVQRVSPT
jgi:hypothetical protein